jgi:hypothetical protein
MDKLHERNNLKPVYFFLVAQSTGSYDKNISVENREFISLVRDIASRYNIGLHPSWASGDHLSFLQKEKIILEKMADAPVTSSRQHFIRMNLPATYLQLISAGIANDYTMGYGSINGFRASVASSFYWYDLKHEITTQLLVHPFCFMDANSFYEQKNTPAEALQELMQLHDEIDKVNGTMITIWHNSFLGTDQSFTGWREVYEKFIGSVSPASS